MTEAREEERKKKNNCVFKLETLFNLVINLLMEVEDKPLFYVSNYSVSSVGGLLWICEPTETPVSNAEEFWCVSQDHGNTIKAKNMFRKFLLANRSLNAIEMFQYAFCSLILAQCKVAEKGMEAVDVRVSQMTFRSEKVKQIYVMDGKFDGPFDNPTILMGSDFDLATVSPLIFTVDELERINMGAPSHAYIIKRKPDEVPDDLHTVEHRWIAVRTENGNTYNVDMVGAQFDFFGDKLYHEFAVSNDYSYANYGVLMDHDPVVQESIAIKLLQCLSLMKTETVYGDEEEKSVIKKRLHVTDKIHQTIDRLIRTQYILNQNL